jgi:hypothetical protein
MAANRKKQTGGIRFGPAVKALLICLLIGGAGIGYVWEKNQIYSLGRQIKESENKLADLRRQNKVKADQLAFLKSPALLEAKVKEMKLGLVPPAPEMVVTLVDAAPTGAPVPQEVIPAPTPAPAPVVVKSSDKRSAATPTKIASVKH